MPNLVTILSALGIAVVLALLGLAAFLFFQAVAIANNLAESSLLNAQARARQAGWYDPRGAPETGPAGHVERSPDALDYASEESLEHMAYEALRKASEEALAAQEGRS